MFRLLVVLLVLLLIPAATFAAEPVTVSLPLLAMQTGQNDTVEAWINCSGEGCSAFDITIEFDPDVIQVDHVEVGPFLGEQVFTAENTIDNEVGIMRLAAVALGDPTNVGESVLLRLAVTTLNPGASQLRITRLDIGDLVGNPLQTLGIDGGVVVNHSADSSAQVTQMDTATTSTTDVTPATESQQPLCQYRVNAGDTLSGIAIANGVTIDQIAALNQIPDLRVIRIGQVLTIPASDCYAALISGEDIAVFDCRHLGGNVFEWYSARRTFDASGSPIRDIHTGGPFTGAWQPGCPGGERPSRSSGGGSADGAGGGNSGATPALPDDNDNVYPPPPCGICGPVDPPDDPGMAQQ